MTEGLYSNTNFSSNSETRKSFIIIFIFRIDLIDFSNLNKPLLLTLVAAFIIEGLYAAEVYHIGASTFWTSGNGSNIDWVAVPGANDPNDGLKTTEIDLVGDDNDPGLYWSSSDTYLFFRSRLAINPAGAGDFSGAHFVLIDVVGAAYDSGIPGLGPETKLQKNLPDYGITWDSKSNDPATHGLEMQVYSDSPPNNWNGINMDDIDGIQGKGVNDINGDGRTSDGYVRSIDGQITTSFGNTTFLDFAVSWDYLTTYTDLNKSQDWQLVLASIANATDHNNITGDISGGVNPADLRVDGWVVVPEISSGILLLLAGAAGGMIQFLVKNKRR